MALEGNAKDFGLSEILQLIALQKKTGMLSITGEKAMVIYFREGQVISTRDRRKMADDPLRSYLLGYGFLSDKEMNRIQQIQTETNLDITDILISEKKFSEDELRIIFAEQIQETIQEILSCPKSQYKFMIGSQVLQGVNSFGTLKVEGLLMESMRRIDEFPELLRIFKSEDTIVTRLPMPKDAREELDEMEKSVYDLLDRQMRIGDIIPRARMARFCTYEVLKNLLEKSLLQIIEGERPAEIALEDDIGGMSAPPRRGYVWVLAAAGLLAACFAFGEFIAPKILPPGWRFLGQDSTRAAAAAGPGTLAPTLGDLTTRLVAADVREALDEHLAANAAYPASLETLVSKGLLPKRILDEAVERGISYHPANGGKSYSLENGRP
ncbi:MAG: DUF4388 domain-containing protein [Candidatus Krumholzibacteria bacterium]|nr:DUF4388 domain-containing protein [Candidatus Krumholzibacteria bacterium]